MEFYRNRRNNEEGKTVFIKEHRYRDQNCYHNIVETGVIYRVSCETSTQVYYSSMCGVHIITITESHNFFYLRINLNGERR
jgi:hypothetical protein